MNTRPNNIFLILININISIFFKCSETVICTVSVSTTKISSYNNSCQFYIKFLLYSFPEKPQSYESGFFDVYIVSTLESL